MMADSVVMGALPSIEDPLSPCSWTSVCEIRANGWVGRWTQNCSSRRGTMVGLFRPAMSSKWVSFELETLPCLAPSLQRTPGIDDGQPSRGDWAWKGVARSHIRQAVETLRRAGKLQLSSIPRLTTTMPRDVDPIISGGGLLASSQFPGPCSLVQATGVRGWAPTGEVRFAASECRQFGLVCQICLKPPQP